MARIARVVAEHYPHHITQRGNRRQDTFFCESDCRDYIRFMAEWYGDVSNDEYDLLQRHERTGRHLGGIQFMERLENRLDRILIPQKGGRPKKIR